MLAFIFFISACVLAFIETFSIGKAVVIGQVVQLLVVANYQQVIAIGTTLFAEITCYPCVIQELIHELHLSLGGAKVTFIFFETISAATISLVFGNFFTIS